MPLHSHGGTPHTKRQQRRKLHQELTFEQAAGDLQHDVDAEPFNSGRWERAVGTHLAGHRPAPTTGGTLSISENAAQLAALAGSTAERGAVQQAIQGVEDLRAQAMNLLGSNAAQAATVGGAAEAARAALETADGMVAMLLAAISDAASYHGG